MASTENFAAYVLEQLDGADTVWVRKMFGEYAVYSGEKVIGLIIDNELFLKPTAAARAFIGTRDEEPPFPGAKPYFRIGDGLDDAVWMAELVTRSAQELPAPKPKKARARKAKPTAR
jgi:TfoX/Sxy family transcriptional regulator of competence genes